MHEVSGAMCSFVHVYIHVHIYRVVGKLNMVAILPFAFKIGLEDTARYVGPGFFCPLVKMKAYYAVLVHFWQFLVSGSNLGNF